MALPPPSPDGLDLTSQARLTLDRRERAYGVSDGPYAQVMTELAIPGVSSYDYAAISARVFWSWRLPRDHSVELRGYGNVGYRLPFHDEWTLGAASDLRGYPTEQFRGDVRVLGRAEYSVPIARWKSFAFRALGFADSGYVGFHLTGDGAERDYLPGQVGAGQWRSDLGGGFRIYFSTIVLPLLGFDVGYGLENHAPTLYLQVGITDF